MNLEYQCILNEIERAEADILLWQALVDKVSSINKDFIHVQINCYLIWII